MRLAVLLALLLCWPTLAAAQKPRTLRSPQLANRQEVIRERDAVARRLLGPGDSIIVYVFALVDETGKARDLEIKDDVDDSIKNAALALVRKMRFTPGLSDGKPKAVLLKIPVKFAHPRKQ